MKDAEEEVLDVDQLIDVVGEGGPKDRHPLN